MNHMLSRSRTNDHVDGLLKSFFKRQMPDPWPEARVVVRGRVGAQNRSWFQSYGRLALVASVAIVLLGYLALAAGFPAEPESGLLMDRSQMIGSLPGLELVPTPGGGQAILCEETLPAHKGERPTIIIKVFDSPQQP